MYLACPQGLFILLKTCVLCTARAFYFPQKVYFCLKHAPRGFPELLKDLPELTQRPAGPPERPGAVPGGGFTGQVAQSDGRVFKNEGLGILIRILIILRILLKWWQQVRPRPYLPHAPGARMT